MVENRQRAVVETYFELGETDESEALFEQWLAADPSLGVGVDWLGRPALLREQPPQGPRPGRGAARSRILLARRQGP
ncbi:MAG: hypothetical protein ACRDL5_06270 [Solirubrobacteraceae bacterium]